MPNSNAKITALKEAIITIEQLKHKLNRLELSNNESIAIVGMGCRFPKSENIPKFWDLLINGESGIQEIPLERWNLNQFYDPNVDTQGKISTKWGGFLKDIDRFDPSFFGISPKEAEHMDPQQRLLLEVTWQAFENAGYIPERLRKSNTGVFVGMGNNDYSQFTYGNYQINTGYTGTGNAHCITANRISYLFDFIGPSMAVDTACSSSLVAVHLAVNSLRNKECDFAVAAGVNLILTPDVHISFSKAHMMALDGKCKTFDKDADGYVRSEGCGVILLKRLGDALVNNDKILAVIRGSAINQDGKSNGLTAPNKLSQIEVIKNAVKNANIQVNDINWIETHGTGTKLGDPIEVEALSEIFKGTSFSNEIILGAVKTNIGHLEAAAGIASIIKVVLSINNNKVPKNINFNSLNPLIKFNNLNFIIPTENVSWSKNARKRLVGISSFGFGGTNAHLIIEEPPDSIKSKNDQILKPLNIITISAKDPNALINYFEAHKKYLDGESNINFQNYCYSANIGKSHFNYRKAIIANDKNDLINKLKILMESKKENIISSKNYFDLKICFLFTGQGSQYLEMGKLLYDTEPIFKREFEKCTKIFEQYLKVSLIELLFSNKNRPDLINNTAYAQPLLFTIDYSLAQMWIFWGVKPNILIGHSLGEYVAAACAEVFSLDDAIKLVYHRSDLMHSLPENGAMVSVSASANIVKNILNNFNELSIAAINSPNNTVISGNKEDIEKIIKNFNEIGIKTDLLKVSHAFHSKLMEPILNKFEMIADKVVYHEPKFPIVSNITGDFVKENQISNAKYWKSQIRKEVRFFDSMLTVEKNGIDVFLEIGPHPVLTAMGQFSLPDSKARWLYSLKRNRNNWEVILETLAALYEIGFEINWENFDKYYFNSFVFTPNYPFNKQRYWISGNISKKLNDFNFDDQVKTKNPFIGKKFESPIINDKIYEINLNFELYPILNEHRIFNLPLLPAAGYIELVYANVKFETEKNFVISNLNIFNIIPFHQNKSTKIQLIIKNQNSNKSEFELYSTQIENSKNKSIFNNWEMNANGLLEFENLSDSTNTNSLELNIFKSKLYQVSSHEINQFYSEFNKKGFNHGPIYKVINEVYYSDSEILCKLSLNEKDINSDENYYFHPALLDAGIQSVALFFYKNKNLSRPNEIYLPNSLEKYTLFHSRFNSCWSYIKFKGFDDYEKDLCLDIAYFDSKGNLIVNINKVRLLGIVKSTLIKSYYKNFDKALYKLVWRERSIEISKSIEPGKWIFFNNKISSESFSKKLKSYNYNFVEVNISDKFFKVSDKNSNINYYETSDVEKLLNTISNDNQNKLKGIIYSCDTNIKLNDELDSNSLIQYYKFNFEFMLKILQALSQINFKQRIKFFIQTEYLFPDRISKTLNPLNSPLVGFIKSAINEFSSLDFRIINMNNCSNSEIEDNVINEILSEDYEPTVSYEGGRRFVERLEQYNLSSTLRDNEICGRLEIKEKGLLENIRFNSFNRTQPKKGQIEIKVISAGLNFRDVLNALDLYPGDAGPLGGECSGIITSLGEGVTNFKIGDEVLGITPASFSSYTITDQNLIVKKPKTISFEQAAAIPIAFITSWYSLVYLGNIKKGNKVLIHSASGGVGLAAIQISKLFGGIVFATAGSIEKREFLLKNGADYVFNSRTLEFADEIKKLTNNEGIDLILNSLNGEYIPKGLSLLASGGKFLEIGKIGIWKDEQIIEYRNDIHYYKIAIDEISNQKPELIQKILFEIIDQFNFGNISPINLVPFDLVEAQNAFRLMRNAKHIGKIIINVSSNKLPNKIINNVKSSIEIKSESTYLITGGRGELGLKFAEWLIEKGAKYLILLGRSEPSEEIINKINKFELKGVKILTPQVDISNFEALNSFFDNAFGDNMFPSLKGIIHSVGVLNDKLILNSNWNDFEIVFNSKIQGAWNIHRLVKNMNLDFIVYNSSIASVIGSPGQSNYSAANSFQDMLAIYQSSINLPAKSINWGPWSEIGMAAKKKNSNPLQKEIIDSIDPNEGLLMFEEIINQNDSQICILNLKKENLKNISNEKSNMWLLFSDLISEVKTEKILTNSEPELLTLIKETNTEKQQEIIKQFLVKKIKKILSLEENFEINMEKPLNEFGFDSLMAVELKKILDKATGQNLPASMVFNYPTITKLAGFVEETLSEEAGNNQEIIQNKVESKIDDFTQKVENMSEEEAEKELLKKLGISE